MLRKGEIIIVVFRETNYRISYIRWELLINHSFSLGFSSQLLDNY